MSIRPIHGLIALVLAVAASVASSQSPLGGPDSNQSAPPELSPRAGFGAAGSMFGITPPTGNVPAAAAAGQMIAFSSVDPAGTQTFTLIDTSKSWMAVYHVDRSGRIRLVSSRPIEADFSLQLNVTSPLPEEIRRIGKR